MTCTGQLVCDFHSVHKSRNIVFIFVLLECVHKSCNIVTQPDFDLNTFACYLFDLITIICTCTIKDKLVGDLHNGYESRNIVTRTYLI